MAGLVLNNGPTIGPSSWNPSNVVGSSSTVTANGRQIIVLDKDQVITHVKPGKNPDPKSGLVIATSKVFIEGKRAAQIGDICTHGEVLVKSSPNIFIA
ncbi:MAG: PAAR domain-containing protein [Culicoidibacterales bacterium]